MRIGIPKETFTDEKRVAITPSGVDMLVKAGHTIFIESTAGEKCQFTDEDYRNVGANVVYSSDEVFQRSEFISKVAPITESEIEFLQEGQIIFSFLHLEVGKKHIIEKLMEKKVTAISYELVERDGSLPVLQSMSEIAGQLAVEVGESYLADEHENSRGILMGGLTGVAGAAVVILGAGVVGLNAARAAIGRGAQVIILDKDLRRLNRIENIVAKDITTVVANPYTIERSVKYADLLIAAVSMPGTKSPHLVTEEMVKTMKKGSVIIDVSIDQGGCVETSHPTSLTDPVFVKDNVIHYCVPNIPARVCRTASFAITNVVVPYIENIANNGLSHALTSDEGLVKGVCVHNGTCSNKVIAESFGLEFRRLHLFSTN